ncbi:MAG: UvrD-helicase domain-containing protein, partial [Firmicutes bacterium]|nr:UvrD-helicase domain-containing protein [Bacillota bacterium]
MNWTQEQARAIELRNKNILVAAAAGSGKTAVLVERIKQLILKDRCPIDRMLIVTFTNAAASEMKEKIERTIGQAIRETENKDDLFFLKKQLDLLPTANISTFHAFALEVIRRYFYIIDVEPNFKICDGTQQTILRGQAMDQLIEERFEEGSQ